MENSVKTLGKQGQALADTATDKVQGGIREAGATLSNKVDEIRDDAAPGFRQAAARAQAMGKQGLDAVTDVAGRARDTVSSASQSIIDYTKENPVKALAIAAVSGALLVTVARAIKASRD
ncbi:MAG: hypothetical protein ABSG30_08535 [Steroidobacteraceae bacterium]|jgi:ElaB/YqjD/DUF883 family membrane-anchored ribosome-binding protein